MPEENHNPAAPDPNTLAGVSYQLGLLTGKLDGIQEGQIVILRKLEDHEKIILEHSPAIQCAKQTIERMDPVVEKLERSFEIIAVIGKYSKPIGKAFALCGSAWMILASAVPKAQAWIAHITNHPGG